MDQSEDISPVINPEYGCKDGNSEYQYKEPNLRSDDFPECEFFSID